MAAYSTVNSFNLGDIHIMKRAAGIVVVPFGKNFPVDEIRFFHRCLEKFAAVKHETGFGERDGAAFKFDSGQTGFPAFVEIAPAFRTAEFKRLSLRLREERQTQAFFRLDEFMRITFRPDEYDRHRLVPKPAEPAPARRHHIETLLLPGANKHPIASDELEHILIGEVRQIDFIH